jgi:hypothetical protein
MTTYCDSEDRILGSPPRRPACDLLLVLCILPCVVDSMNQEQIQGWMIPLIELNKRNPTFPDGNYDHLTANNPPVHLPQHTAIVTLAPEFMRASSYPPQSMFT